MRHIDLEWIKTRHHAMTFWDKPLGCLPLAVLVTALSLIGGCRTIKTDEKTDIQDSIRTEYIEKIVEVPVYIEVEVPAESKQRETRDSTSFLETSFARSWARLTWIDGFPWLYHDLENKPQTIGKEAKVPVKERYKIIYRTRYVTRTKYTVQQLTWWQQMKVDFAEYVLGFIVILILVIVIVRFKKKGSAAVGLY